MSLKSFLFLYLLFIWQALICTKVIIKNKIETVIERKKKKALIQINGWLTGYVISLSFKKSWQSFAYKQRRAIETHEPIKSRLGYYQNVIANRTSLFKWPKVNALEYFWPTSFFSPFFFFFFSLQILLAFFLPVKMLWYWLCSSFRGLDTLSVHAVTLVRSCWWFKWLADSWAGYTCVADEPLARYLWTEKCSLSVATRINVYAVTRRYRTKSYFG